MADAAISGHAHEDNRSYFTTHFISPYSKDTVILYLITSVPVWFPVVPLTVYMRLDLMTPCLQ